MRPARCHWPSWCPSPGPGGRSKTGFAAGKELAALDEHQVRGWTSWHRWTILALLARAFLSVLAAARPHGSDPDDGRLIPLTRHEIRRLFTGLHQQPSAPARQLHWSWWRRRHQATARRCHYQRRQAPPPARGSETRLPPRPSPG
jgi:hypothetical protein